MKHGPDSECDGCQRIRDFADKEIGKEYNEANCKVCQGWGWAQGCPGCGRVWKKLWPLKEKSNEG